MSVAVCDLSERTVRVTAGSSVEQDMEPLQGCGLTEMMEGSHSTNTRERSLTLKDLLKMEVKN